MGQESERDAAGGKGKDAGKSSLKLAIGLEKTAAKVEMLEAERQRYSEKFERISEGIGDLRRMLLDREESQKKVEMESEKIRDMMAVIEPEKLAAMKEGVSKRLEVLEARIERGEKIGERADKDIRELRDVFSKVKSIESLVEILKEIDEKVRKVKASEENADRMAGRIETLYYDFNRGLMETKKGLEAVSRLDGLSKELIREVDRIKLMLKSVSDDEKRRLAEKLGLSKEGGGSDMEEVPNILKKQEETEKSIKELSEKIVSLESSMENAAGLQRRLDILESGLKKEEDMLALLERKMASSEKSSETVAIWKEEMESIAKKLESISSAIKGMDSGKADRMEIEEIRKLINEVAV